MTYKFTASAENVLEIANDLAEEMGHSYIGTEHLLFGLIKEGSGVASKIFENANIEAEDVLEKIDELIGSENNGSKIPVGFTPRTKRTFENAYLEAKKLGVDYIGTEHILLGILREIDSIAVRILLDLGMDIENIYTEIMNTVNEFDSRKEMKKENQNSKNSFNITQTLNQYGNDLTKIALDGKLDPVIGRKDETERLIEILSRRSKNNPCLIGEPGVGKTAVVEGLAEKIIQGNVPENLKNKRVVSLDITSMIAGAKYRGDFEDRIKKCLSEVKKAGDIILFIDEIHTIVGAGAAEGAIDAANILKPMLARGEIQVVGATTINEYRKYKEKDSALERRFGPIMVKEPSEEECILILKGLRDKYEAHHNVKITDEAIIASVKLSNRYINDRYLPDKAIDLIDEASAKQRLKTFVEPKKLKEIQEKIEEYIREKEDSIKRQDFEKAAEYRDKERKEKNNLEKEKNLWEEKRDKTISEITEENIAEVVARWTGISVNKINQSENSKLRNLEDTIHQRVIGQEEAVKAVAKAIRRSRVGLKDPNRPIGTFLFLGPTGVGKTELTKALTDALFGNENSMVRIDMSEYMEPHSVSKIIGSPPGYIGYDEAGGLTEKVRRNPYTVILFDEIEKAHPDVMNILLQLLDDGRLTDSTGRTVDFKNTVIIMTSNIGARLITDKKVLGFEKNDNNIEKEYEELKKSVMQEVKREFKPEFLNRVDDIIVFHKLNEENIGNIIDIMLSNVKKRMKEKNIKIKFDKKVKELIARKGTDINYGARPLRRAIQNLVEDKIAEEILNDNIKEGDEITISANEKEVIIKVKLAV